LGHSVDEEEGLFIYLLISSKGPYSLLQVAYSNMQRCTQKHKQCTI